MSDVNAAAERLIRCEYDEENGEILKRDGKVYSRSLDGLAVAKAYRRHLAEHADDGVKWYDWNEVSREIWNGDIWWWNNGDQVFPVNIAWSPTDEQFFATLGQWGWSRSQLLSEMQGRWTPCREPEPEPEHYDPTI